MLAYEWRAVPCAVFRMLRAALQTLLDALREVAEAGLKINLPMTRKRERVASQTQ
jgi:hypothetical protein